MSNNNEAGTASSSKMIIGVIVVLLAALLIFSLTGSDDSNQAVTSNDSNEVSPGEQLADGEDMIKDEMSGDSETPVAAGDETMMDKDEDMMVKTETDLAIEGDTVIAPTANVAGTYTDYDEALLANANDGSVVLFFHADWCPSCRGLDNNIKENLSQLPGDVTIMQLDYDSETELKQKYGVVRQHTLVQVDANGNEIQTLTGLTNTLDQVLAKL